MNFKTTGWLLLLLAAATGYYFFYEADQKTALQREQDAKNRVHYLFPSALRNVEKVTRVAILSESNEASLASSDSYVFSYRSGKWRQLQPAPYPMKSLPWVSRLLQVKYLQKIGKQHPHYNKKINQYFKKPYRKIIYHFNDGSQRWVTLGKEMIGGNAFLMIENDSHIYQIQDDVYSALSPEQIQSHYLQKLRLPFRYQVQEIAISSPASRLIMKRHRTDRWQFAQGAWGPVNPQRIDQLLALLKNQSLTDFRVVKKEDLKLYQLEKPQIKLTFKQGQSALTLAFGAIISDEKKQVLRYACWIKNKKDTHYVIFSCQSSPLEDLPKQAAFLTDTKLITTAALDIQRLSWRAHQADDSVKGGIVDFDYQLTPAGWVDRIKPDAPMSVSKSNIATYIKWLSSGEILTFRKRDPRAKLIGTLSVYPLPASPVESLKFYRVGKALQVVRNNEPYAAVFAQSLWH